jgi:hypothetical protein
MLNANPRRYVMHRSIGLFMGVSLFVMPYADWQLSAIAQSASVKVAPNLMVVFATSYSMNYELGGRSLPPIADPNEIPYFDDSRSPWLGHPAAIYGNQATSRIAQAKTVMRNLMSASTSDNINFGFATYRQAFGLQLASADRQLNAVGTQLTPKDPNIYSKTADEKRAYAMSRDNFSDPTVTNFYGLKHRLCWIFYNSTQNWFEANWQSGSALHWDGYVPYFNSPDQKNMDASGFTEFGFGTAPLF